MEKKSYFHNLTCTKASKMFPESQIKLRELVHSRLNFRDTEICYEIHEFMYVR